jgi:hypothetical protein
MGESSVHPVVFWAFSLYFFSDCLAKDSLALNSTLFSSFRIVRPSLRSPFVTMIPLVPA